MNILNVLLLSFSIDAGAVITDYSERITIPVTQLYYAEYSFILSDTREILYLEFSIENYFAKSNQSFFFAPGMDIYTSEFGIKVKNLNLYVNHNCCHLIENESFVIKMGWQSLTKLGIRLEI